MYPHSKTYGMQPFDILRRDSKLSEVQFLNCQNDSKSTRHANRLINFYEYDARRDLQKRGKILKHLCWPTIFILKKRVILRNICCTQCFLTTFSPSYYQFREWGGLRWSYFERRRRERPLAAQVYCNWIWKLTFPSVIHLLQHRTDPCLITNFGHCNIDLSTSASNETYDPCFW